MGNKPRYQKRKREKYAQYRPKWRHDCVADGTEDDQKRGETAENNIEEALKVLKEMGVIENYRRTVKLSKDDSKGIDFYVFTEDKRLTMQVKSSDKAASKAYQRGVIFGTCRDIYINGHGGNLVNRLMGLIKKLIDE